MRKTLLGAATLALVLGGTSACKKKSANTAEQGPVYEGNLFAEGFTEQSIASNITTEKPATDFGEACVGFVTDEPATEFRIAGALPMRIEVVADVDSVLVIEGPGGPHCKDDDVDHNAALGRVWEPGDYKVWVGSYQRQEESFFYELNFVHFDPNADPVDERAAYFASLNKDAPRAPEPSTPLVDAKHNALALDGDATLGAIYLAPNAAATEYELDLEVAERLTQASNIHADCAGLIDPTTPDQMIVFAGGGPINFVVNSEDNTTIVARGPGDKIWCADNVLEQNPALHIADAEEGRYYFWFGIKNEATDRLAGTLTVY